MDERKQYVPTDFDTYTAKDDTVSLKQKTTVEAAAERGNDYKDIEDVPSEQNIALIRNDRRREWYENL